MGVGVIGAGTNGTAIARAFARAGMQVIISNSRGPDTLKHLARRIGPTVRGGTREEAAASEMVVVAVNWSNLAAAVSDLPDWGGRIVVDANNPIEPPLFKTEHLGGRSSSEVFADLVPGASVIKAFNHLEPHLIANPYRGEGARRVLFYSGDNKDAKERFGGAVDWLGFFGVDLGPLAIGSRLTQYPAGPLARHEFLKAHGRPSQSIERIGGAASSN
jgi:predicted dinucleotide-binding enzyme